MKMPTFAAFAVEAGIFVFVPIAVRYAALPPAPVRGGDGGGVLATTN